MGKRGIQHRFVTGGPVDPSQHVGRDDLIGLCFEDIQKCSSVFLRGGPKTGKSSLLKKLRDPATRMEELGEEGEYIVPVYISGHDLNEKVTPEEFWKKVLTALHKRLQGDKPAFPQAFTEEEVETYLEVLKKPPHELTPLLLLDEAEVWVALPNLRADFFNRLRSLQNQGLLCMVMASQKDLAWNQVQLKHKGQSGSETLNLCTPRFLEELSLRESQQVLRQGRMEEGPELELILKLSSGHPFCLQALGKSRLECMKNHWYPDDEQFRQTVTALWECSTDEEQVKLLRWSACLTDAADSDEAPRLFPPILRLAFRVCRPWFPSEGLTRQNTLSEKDLADFICEKAQATSAVERIELWARDAGLNTAAIKWNQSPDLVARAVAVEAIKTGKAQALVARITEDYPDPRRWPSQDTLPPALQRLVAHGILEDKEAQSLYEALRAPQDWKKGFDALRNELLPPGGDP